MSFDKDWDTIRSDRYNRVTDAGMGLLRITLLFGSAAIALALLVTPFLESRSRTQVADSFIGVDTMSTGSIGQRTYTIRKSVLQSSPTAVCVIGQDGRRRGDC